MYNTGNPVPSSALEDMADNAHTFDALVTKTEGTTTDRLGRTRRVFQQILMDMGFQPLAGSFQTGATITARNQTLYDEVSHVFYAWGGTIPVGGYVIPTDSTPTTAGGIGVGAWSDKTDLMLRSDLNIVQKRLACVADMIADTSLTVGKIVETLGYHAGWAGSAERPKGGNRYEIVEAGTGTHDGGSFIALSNGLQAKGLFVDAVVNVYQFGVKGDSITDDTYAIQAAIDTGNSVDFADGTYKVTGLTVSNKSNISYFSNNNAIITNVGAILTGRIFKLIGSIDNITWRGLSILGNGIVTGNNSAIGCDSGQTGTNLTFENLYINNVSIGISLNADLAGSFKNCYIRNCRFKDIVGEAPGTGYAIHLPYAYDTVVDSCIFDNVSRHAIYVPRGGRVTISNCHILNHRKDVATNSTRPAILIARNSHDCQIIGCTFDTYWDGAIGITSETSAIADNENNVIIGCCFRNPQNTAANAISVGEQITPSGGSKVNGLTVDACKFYSDGTSTPTFVKVFNGWNIHIRNGFFSWSNVDGNVVGIEFGTIAPNANDCAYVSSENCVFYASGTSGQLRAVITQGYLGSNVDKTVTVNNTQFYADPSITIISWHSPSFGFANTGVQGTGRSGGVGRGFGTAAPSNGAWVRGDIVWSIVPTAGGTVGWICTVSGTPGTWKTFGSISL